MEPIQQRTISQKAFIGPYAGAIAAGVVLALLCFAVFPLLAPLGLLPFVAALAWAWLVRSSASYRLYPDRLEIERGILSRSIENLELFRVRDVSLRQGLFGRMAGFGDVLLHSTDASSPEIAIRGIDEPREFYQQVRQLASDSRARNRTLLVEEGATLTDA